MAILPPPAPDAQPPSPHPVMAPFATPDYSLPSPHEVAKIAVRYGTTSGGNQYRTWKPSKQRAAAVRRIVFERDNHTCQHCGLCVEPGAYGLALDHIRPYRDGGLFYPGNLQTLCHSCNSRKGARA